MRQKSEYGTILNCMIHWFFFTVAWNRYFFDVCTKHVICFSIIIVTQIRESDIWPQCKTEHSFQDKKCKQMASFVSVKVSWCFNELPELRCYCTETGLFSTQRSGFKLVFTRKLKTKIKINYSLIMHVYMDNIYSTIENRHHGSLIMRLMTQLLIFAFITFVQTFVKIKSSAGCWCLGPLRHQAIYMVFTIGSTRIIGLEK